jgi:hypothetical protein
MSDQSGRLEARNARKHLALAAQTRAPGVATSCFIVFLKAEAAWSRRGSRKLHLLRLTDGGFFASPKKSDQGSWNPSPPSKRIMPASPTAELPQPRLDIPVIEKPFPDRRVQGNRENCPSSAVYQCSHRPLDPAKCKLPCKFPVNVPGARLRVAGLQVS